MSQFLIPSAGRRDWDDDPQSRPGGRVSPRFIKFLGMWLFLATVAVLFAGLMVAFIFMRSWQPTWPAPGSPTFTWGFGVSTFLMLASSGMIEVAVLQYRRGLNGHRPAASLMLAAGLGVAFLLCQAFNWASYLGRDGMWVNWQVAGFVYVFTAIHALHVVGGVGPLALVAWRARRGGYTRQDHVGVRLCAMYWHLLGVVWLVMLAAMFARPAS